MRTTCIIALSLALLSTLSAQAEVRATVEAVSIYSAPDPWVTPDWACQNGADAPMILRIFDNQNLLLKENYCALDSSSSARMISDRRGNEYLFLEYGGGARGTETRLGFLDIFRFRNSPASLEKLQTVQLSQWLGYSTEAEYRYRILQPQGGGLQVIFTRRISGTDFSFNSSMPPRQKIVNIGLGGQK